MSDDARVRELEEQLAQTSVALVEFSAVLGRERAERERASRERDEYRKLYELVAIELERVKRQLPRTTAVRTSVAGPSPAGYGYRNTVRPSGASLHAL